MRVSGQGMGLRLGEIPEHYVNVRVSKTFEVGSGGKIDVPLKHVISLFVFTDRQW